MDSNFWYRGTKAVDFRSIPGIIARGLANLAASVTHLYGRTEPFLNQTCRQGQIEPSRRARILARVSRLGKAGWEAPAHPTPRHDAAGDHSGNRNNRESDTTPTSRE
jgi:hypothetical protein